MAYTLPGNVSVQDGVWTLPWEDGYSLKVVFAWPNMFNVQHGEPVNTLRLEFVSASFIGFDTIMQAILTKVIPVLGQNGEEILSYYFWQQPIVSVGVPERVCVNFLGDEYCWTPPFAGQEVISAHRYVLWILTRPAPGASALGVRPLGPGVILAIAAGLAVILVLMLGIVSVQNGTVSWEKVAQFTDDVITAPGRNFGEAVGGATWPLAAFGMSLVAASLALPFISTTVGAEVPIGPAKITGEVAGASRPPPSPPRRR